MVWMLRVGYPAHPITFFFLHVENGCRCNQLKLGDVTPVIPVVRSFPACEMSFFFLRGRFFGGAFFLLVSFCTS